MNHGLKAFQIKIFFKSGNSVILDGVTECSTHASDGTFKALILQQQDLPSQTRLYENSLDVGSVEAVVRLPIEEPSA